MGFGEVMGGFDGWLRRLWAGSGGISGGLWWGLVSGGSASGKVLVLANAVVKAPQGASDVRFFVLALCVSVKAANGGSKTEIFPLRLLRLVTASHSDTLALRGLLDVIVQMLSRTVSFLPFW